MIQTDDQWRRVNLIDGEELAAFHFSRWKISLKCKMSVLLSTLRKDARFFNRYFQHVKGNLNFLKDKGGNKDNFVSSPELFIVSHKRLHSNPKVNGLRLLQLGQIYTSLTEDSVSL